MEIQNNELFERDADTNALVPVVSASAEGAGEVRDGKLHRRDPETNALIPIVFIENLPNNEQVPPGLEERLATLESGVTELENNVTEAAETAVWNRVSGKPDIVTTNTEVLTSGGSNYSYELRRNGAVVQLRATISNYADNSGTRFTIPEGWRPSSDISLSPFAGSSGYGSSVVLFHGLTIRTSGAVSVEGWIQPTWMSGRSASFSITYIQDLNGAYVVKKPKVSRDGGGNIAGGGSRNDTHTVPVGSTILGVYNNKSGTTGGLQSTIVGASMDSEGKTITDSITVEMWNEGSGTATAAYSFISYMEP